MKSIGLWDRTHSSRIAYLQSRSPLHNPRTCLHLHARSTFQKNRFHMPKTLFVPCCYYTSQSGTLHNSLRLERWKTYRRDNPSKILRKSHLVLQDTCPRRTHHTYPFLILQRMYRPYTESKHAGLSREKSIQVGTWNMQSRAMLKFQMLGHFLLPSYTSMSHQSKYTHSQIESVRHTNA